MTLGKIANRVAKYLHKSRSLFLDDGGDDIIIAALNNARNAIERDHDFFYQQAEVGVVVDPVTGGDLMNDAVLMDGDSLSATAASVKSVYRAYYQNSTNTAVWFPMLLDPKQLLSKKAVEQNYKFRGYPTRYTTFQYRDVPLSRYGGDPRNYLTTRPFRAYFVGNDVFIDPRPNEDSTCKFDVQLWMTPYLHYIDVSSSSTASPTVTVSVPFASLPSTFTLGITLLGQTVTAAASGGPATTTVTLSGNASRTITVVQSCGYWYDGWTDWLIEEGEDYLFWYALCECNMYTNTYVARQEGYQAPPEKQRELAKQSLIVKDDYTWENAREPLLIR